MIDNLLTVSEIRECEQWTMQHEPIESIDLMERAGKKFAEALTDGESVFNTSEYYIFCGPGNNGGDGLVIARQLALKHLKVTVIRCTPPNGKCSSEFNTNWNRWESLNNKGLSVNTIHYSPSDLPIYSEQSVIIDALFGIGLTRPLNDYYTPIVQHINTSRRMVIAVDVPSGLFLEQSSKGQAVINATKTFTFQFNKTAFLLPENYIHVGEISVLDIGIVLSDNIKPKSRLITASMAKLMYKPLCLYAHKGNNGHGLLIAGSKNMPGAALLSAKSALRAGIGKVSVHLPNSITPLLPIAIPEAIIDPDQDANCFTQINFDSDFPYNAIAIGPGLGNSPATEEGIKTLLSEVNSPMVIDADAINFFQHHKEWLDDIPQNSILTPHFKEFERIAGYVNDDFERVERVKKFAQRYSVIVILKGAHSIVAMPDGKLLINTSGNPGMGTAGSGDVLTGLLLAMLAKGYLPPIAAILGTYIHGLAADMAVNEFQSEESLIASDIADYYGAAFKHIKKI